MSVETIILAVAIGVLAGTLSGLLGLGGGTVLVPLLVIVLGLEEHVAQGVAIAVVIPTGLVTTWTNWRLGNIVPHAALWLAIGAAIGALAGANLANTLDGPLLRRLFAIVLVVIGVRILPKNMLETTWRWLRRL